MVGRAQGLLEASRTVAKILAPPLFAALLDRAGPSTRPGAPWLRAPPPFEPLHPPAEQRPPPPSPHLPGNARPPAA